MVQWPEASWPISPRPQASRWLQMVHVSAVAEQNICGGTALFGCPCCALRPLERPLACPFSAVRAPCIPPPRANRSALRPSHRTPQASTPPPSPMSCTCALASAAPFGHRWPRGRRSFQRMARESRGPPSAIDPHIPCAKDISGLIGVARNLAHRLAMPVGDNFMTDQE